MAECIASKIYQINSIMPLELTVLHSPRLANDGFPQHMAKKTTQFV